MPAISKTCKTLALAIGANWNQAAGFKGDVFAATIAS
jgi:hypothetical protein